MDTGTALSPQPTIIPWDQQRKNDIVIGQTSEAETAFIIKFWEQVGLLYTADTGFQSTDVLRKQTTRKQFKTRWVNETGGRILLRTYLEDNTMALMDVTHSDDGDKWFSKRIVGTRGQKRFQKYVSQAQKTCSDAAKMEGLVEGKAVDNPAEPVAKKQKGSINGVDPSAINTLNSSLGAGKLVSESMEAVATRVDGFDGQMDCDIHHDGNGKSNNAEAPMVDVIDNSAATASMTSLTSTALTATATATATTLMATTAVAVDSVDGKIVVDGWKDNPKGSSYLPRGWFISVTIKRKSGKTVGAVDNYYSHLALPFLFRDKYPPQYFRSVKQIKDFMDYHPEGAQIKRLMMSDGWQDIVDGFGILEETPDYPAHEPLHAKRLGMDSRYNAQYTADHCGEIDKGHYRCSCGMAVEIDERFCPYHSSRDVKRRQAAITATIKISKKNDESEQIGDFEDQVGDPDDAAFMNADEKRVEKSRLKAYAPAQQNVTKYGLTKEMNTQYVRSLQQKDPPITDANILSQVGLVTVMPKNKSPYEIQESFRLDNQQSVKKFAKAVSIIQRPLPANTTPQHNGAQLYTNFQLEKSLHLSAGPIAQQELKSSMAGCGVSFYDFENSIDHLRQDFKDAPLVVNTLGVKTETVFGRQVGKPVAILSLFKDLLDDFIKNKEYLRAILQVRKKNKKRNTFQIHAGTAEQNGKKATYENGNQLNAKEPAFITSFMILPIDLRRRIGKAAMLLGIDLLKTLGLDRYMVIDGDRKNRSDKMAVDHFGLSKEDMQYFIWHEFFLNFKTTEHLDSHYDLLNDDRENCDIVAAGSATYDFTEIIGDDVSLLKEYEKELGSLKMVHVTALCSYRKSVGNYYDRKSGKYCPDSGPYNAIESYAANILGRPIGRSNPNGSVNAHVYAESETNDVGNVDTSSPNGKFAYMHKLDVFNLQQPGCEEYFRSRLQQGASSDYKGECVLLDEGLTKLFYFASEMHFEKKLALINRDFYTLDDSISVIAAFWCECNGQALFCDILSDFNDNKYLGVEGDFRKTWQGDKEPDVRLYIMICEEMGHRKPKDPEKTQHFVSSSTARHHSSHELSFQNRPGDRARIKEMLATVKDILRQSCDGKITALEAHDKFEELYGVGHFRGMTAVQIHALSGHAPIEFANYATVSSVGKFGPTQFINMSAHGGRDDRKNLTKEECRSFFKEMIHGFFVALGLLYMVPRVIEQLLCMADRERRNQLKKDLVIMDKNGKWQNFFRVWQRTKSVESLRLEFLYLGNWVDFSEVIVPYYKIPGFTGKTKVRLGSWFKGKEECDVVMPQEPFAPREDFDS